jgi:large subunit ribosomal protein L5
MTPRLLTKYNEDVLPKLREQFGYKNVMEIRPSRGMASSISAVNEAKLDISTWMLRSTN